VRGICALAVWSWNKFRAWYWSSGCLVVESGPCIVLKVSLCGSETRSVRGSGAVAVF
jgi:hypothetical protein